MALRKIAKVLHAQRVADNGSYTTEMRKRLEAKFVCTLSYCQPIRYGGGGHAGGPTLKTVALAFSQLLLVRMFITQVVGLPLVGADTFAGVDGSGRNHHFAQWRWCNA